MEKPESTGLRRAKFVDQLAKATAEAVAMASTVKSKSATVVNPSPAPALKQRQPPGPVNRRLSRVKLGGKGPFVARRTNQSGSESESASMSTHAGIKLKGIEDAFARGKAVEKPSKRIAERHENSNAGPAAAAAGSRRAGNDSNVSKRRNIGNRRANGAPHCAERTEKSVHDELGYDADAEVDDSSPVSPLEMDRFVSQRQAVPEETHPPRTTTTYNTIVQPSDPEIGQISVVCTLNRQSEIVEEDPGSDASQTITHVQQHPRNGDNGLPERVAPENAAESPSRSREEIMFPCILNLEPLPALSPIRHSNPPLQSENLHSDGFHNRSPSVASCEILSTKFYGNQGDVRWTTSTNAEAYDEAMCDAKLDATAERIYHFLQANEENGQDPAAPTCPAGTVDERIVTPPDGEPYDFLSKNATLPPLSNPVDVSYSEISAVTLQKSAPDHEHMNQDHRFQVTGPSGLFLGRGHDEEAPETQRPISMHDKSLREGSVCGYIYPRQDSTHSIHPSQRQGDHPRQDSTHSIYPSQHQEVYLRHDSIHPSRRQGDHLSLPNQQKPSATGGVNYQRVESSIPKHPPVAEERYQTEAPANLHTKRLQEQEHRRELPTQHFKFEAVTSTRSHRDNGNAPEMPSDTNSAGYSAVLGTKLHDLIRQRPNQTNHGTPGPGSAAAFPVPGDGSIHGTGQEIGSSSNDAVNPELQFQNVSHPVRVVPVHSQAVGEGVHKSNKPVMNPPLSADIDAFARAPSTVTEAAVGVLAQIPGNQLAPPRPPPPNDSIPDSRQQQQQQLNHQFRQTSSQRHVAAARRPRSFDLYDFRLPPQPQRPFRQHGKLHSSPCSRFVPFSEIRSDNSPQLQNRSSSSSMPSPAQEPIRSYNANSVAVPLSPHLPVQPQDRNHSAPLQRPSSSIPSAVQGSIRPFSASSVPVQPPPSLPVQQQDRNQSLQLRSKGVPNSLPTDLRSHQAPPPPPSQLLRYPGGEQNSKVHHSNQNEPSLADVHFSQSEGPQQQHRVNGSAANVSSTPSESERISSARNRNNDDQNELQAMVHQHLQDAAKRKSIAQGKRKVEGFKSREKSPTFAYGFRNVSDTLYPPNVTVEMVERFKLQNFPLWVDFHLEMEEIEGLFTEGLSFSARRGSNPAEQNVEHVVNEGITLAGSFDWKEFRQRLTPKGEADVLSCLLPAPTVTSDSCAERIQIYEAMLIEIDAWYMDFRSTLQYMNHILDTGVQYPLSKCYSQYPVLEISRRLRLYRDAFAGHFVAAKRVLGEEAKVPGFKSRVRAHRDSLHRQAAAASQHETMVNNLKSVPVRSIPWRHQRGLPERAVVVLKGWLFGNFLHPYPKDIDKAQLAKATGLTRGQVSNWFINARVRVWKPMIEDMYRYEFPSGSTMTQEVTVVPPDPDVPQAVLVVPQTPLVVPQAQVVVPQVVQVPVVPQAVLRVPQAPVVVPQVVQVPLVPEAAPQAPVVDTVKRGLPSPTEKHIPVTLVPMKSPAPVHVTMARGGDVSRPPKRQCIFLHSPPREHVFPKPAAHARVMSPKFNPSSHAQPPPTTAHAAARPATMPTPPPLKFPKAKAGPLLPLHSADAGKVPTPLPSQALHSSDAGKVQINYAGTSRSPAISFMTSHNGPSPSCSLVSQTGLSPSSHGRSRGFAPHSREALARALTESTLQKILTTANDPKKLDPMLIASIGRDPYDLASQLGMGPSTTNGASDSNSLPPAPAMSQNPTMATHPLRQVPAANGGRPDPGDQQSLRLPELRLTPEEVAMIREGKAQAKDSFNRFV